VIAAFDEFSSAEEALAVARKATVSIGPADLHCPTPCREWDVTAVADHLIDTIARLGAAAGILSSAPSGESIDQRIQQVTQLILEGWRQRGLADDVIFSGRRLPSRLALGILSLELLVHGWDFAVALGRAFRVADAHAAYVLNLAHQTLTPESRVSAGFDPPVPVPDDAGTIDRLIAFTGRDPRQMNTDWASADVAKPEKFTSGVRTGLE
jgi:uncharacterized protein (TIGR03086 family)